MTLGLLLVGVVGSFALTWGAGVVLVPDVSLYLGGFGLFPSLGGTALGSLVGFNGLCLLQAFAVGLLLLVLVHARPSWPALVASLPVLLWLVPLGMDALGTLLLVAGVYAGLRWAPWLAALVHAAALPVAVALAASRSRRALLILPAGLSVGVGLLLATPYGGALLSGRSGFVAPAVVVAVLVTLVGLAPVACSGVARAGRPALAAVAFSTLLATAYVAFADFARPSEPSFGLVLFAATRYALPLTMTALVLGAGRRTERPTTAPGSEQTMRAKSFALTVAVVALVALFVVPAALAQTVPAIPVDQYGDSLLSSLATAIGAIFPYAAAITAFAIGVGMVKRWLGHRKATRV